MKIAVMGAMREEIDPLLAYLSDYQTVEIAANVYYLANYHGHELVLAYSKIGKVFATLTATMMIEHFGAEILLFSGVAGAINTHLSIGDLVIGLKLAQHDLDLTPFGHPFGYVPEGAVFIQSSDSLNKLAQEVATSKGLSLHVGTIATGDQFVASSERKNWIGTTFEADALEMEGAAVAVVCNAMNVPFFVLRAISDSADGQADIDFDTFLESSAKVSADFLISMIEKL